MLIKFINDEAGATAVEYAFILVMLGIISVSIGIVGFLLYCVGVASGVL
jgi:Flp pilus assembly pilin Flp